MMSDQAEVQPDAPEPVPTLDQLLNEVDQPEPKPAEPAVDPDRLNDVFAYVDQQKARDERTALETELTSAVSTLKQVEGLENEDDALLEGHIHRLAFRDQRFTQAFIDRFEKPEAWSKVLETVGKELAEKRQGSSELSQDMAAATASVKGTSQSIPEKSEPSAAEKAAMSDQQWQAHLQSKMAS